MSRVATSYPRRLKIFAGLVAVVLIIAGVSTLGSRASRNDHHANLSPAIPEKTVTAPPVSAEPSVSGSPERRRDIDSSARVTRSGRGIVSFRNELPLSAVEVGKEVLIRYRDQQCWELVVSEMLDFSGAAWGAIFRKSDGTEVAFALALPTVLGREPGPDNPTILSEVLIDVVAQGQAIAGH